MWERTSWGKNDREKNELGEKLVAGNNEGVSLRVTEENTISRNKAS